MPLAELNIAAPKFPLDDPRIADFANNMMRVSSLAEIMPGFRWRFLDQPKGHSDYQPSPWPNTIATMSVWDSAEDLHHFVWNTVHKTFYNRKAEWFDAMEAHHFVMWHVEDGHHPTLAEAKARLDHLNENGDSDFAFGWSHLPPNKRLRAQQCD